MLPTAQAPLRLTLQPGDILPETLNWRIHDGYVRTSAWDEEGESIVLGIWGPGDWVTASYSAIKPIEIQCISTVIVEQFQPAQKDVSELLQRQIQNLEEILLVNRIKLADDRLLSLLALISRRFGQVNSKGYKLSLKDMNLTHKALADISGLTRVTVTKILNRFKHRGLLQQVSKDDLIVPLDAVSAV
ncbi:MAG: Crp/Fnr family transcriptional regulator [Synechococcaceae bacterium WB9_2_170]|nr:Crp/Fnr family transcriptional regulator [Synechococcaceae bacterium WB9_2_170]